MAKLKAVVLACIILHLGVLVGSLPIQDDSNMDYPTLAELLSAYREREVESSPSRQSAEEENDDDPDDSMHSTEGYMERLEECVLIVDNLNLIQKYFYYVEGDEDDLEISQVSLCRLALTLGDVLYTEEKEEPVTTADIIGVLDRQRKIQENKREYDTIAAGPVWRKRSYDRIGQGPLELKRSYDRIGQGPLELKRSYDRIGQGPLELKRSYDRIGQGPLELKRSYDRIGQGPLELKRSYDRIGQGPLELKRSYDRIGQGPLELKRDYSKEAQVSSEDTSDSDESESRREELIKQIEAELKTGKDKYD